jgi:hypothetical protein
MTEPKRLIEADTDPWLTGLLQAGLSESPSTSAYQRTLISVASVGAVVAGSAKAAAITSHVLNAAPALGATQTAALAQNAAHGASLAPAATSAAQGSAAVGAGVAGASAKISGVTAAKIAIPAIAKWVGVAFIGTAGLVAGKSAVNQVWSDSGSHLMKAVSPTLNTEPRPAPAKRVAAQPRADKLPNLNPQPELPSQNDARRSPTPPQPVTVSARLENATRTGATEASPTIQQAPLASSAEWPQASAASPDTGLTLELDLLQAARMKLAQGDANAALSELTVYEKKCRQQQLRPEALLVRLEALERLNQRQRAATVAREILAIDANAQHRARAARALSAVE